MSQSQGLKFFGPNQGEGETPEEPSLTRGEKTIMNSNALEGMHKLGRWFFIITVLVDAALLLGFFAVLLIGLPSWFDNFPGWRIFLPPLIASQLLPFIMWSFSRNLRSSTYTFFLVVMLVFLFPMVVLAIWIVIELTWYCPSHKPLYCTDGISSALTTGYILYVSGVIVQVVAYVAALFFMRSAKHHYTKLTSSFGLTEADAAQAVLDAATGKSSRYVKGIGGRYVE